MDEVQRRVKEEPLQDCPYNAHWTNTPAQEAR